MCGEYEDEYYPTADAEYLSPTLDVVFKMLFGDANNRDMLENLLVTYLELDSIENIELLNGEVTPNEADDKLVRLDLRITSKDHEIDVEVQVFRDKEYADRCISYWAAIHQDAIKRGGKYSAKKVLSLNILGFSYFKDSGGYISNFVWYDPENKRQLSENAKITFVELPKARKFTPEQIRNDDKMAWAAFFNAKSKEDFTMLNQTTENNTVHKAINEISRISADDLARDKARRREEAILTERSRMRAAMEEGEKRGEKKGKEEERKKTVKALRLRGYSEEEIEAIVAQIESIKTDF